MIGFGKDDLHALVHPRRHVTEDVAFLVELAALDDSPIPEHLLDGRTQCLCAIPYEDDERASRRTFEKRLEEISTFRSAGRLLDVGSSTGWLLDAHGVEASEYAIGRRPDLAGRLHDVVFDAFEWDGRRFGVIT